MEWFQTSQRRPLLADEQQGIHPGQRLAGRPADHAVRDAKTHYGMNCSNLSIRVSYTDNKYDY